MAVRDDVLATVARFGLFSSAFLGDAPAYRLEREFPLLTEGGGEVGWPCD